MDTSVRDFYDEFASDYHLMFEDWESSMARQAAAIGSILERECGPPASYGQFIAHLDSTDELAQAIGQVRANCGRVAHSSGRTSIVHRPTVVFYGMSLQIFSKGRGFINIRWLFPAQSFYQPIVIATAG